MRPLQTLGHPNKPALVFLHGFLGRGSDWLPTAESLAIDFHILLPDLPGHGANTNRSPAAPLTFEDLAAELAGLLDSRGIEQAVWIGYSLGGRLALHFSCAYPGRVRALVLESTSAGINDPTERTRRAALDDARAAAILDGGLSAFLESWYAADLWSSLKARPEMLAKLTAARSAGDPAWMARIIAGLSPGRMAPLWDCLPDLAFPVLLLHGMLDEKYAAAAARMAGLLPDASLAAVPGAGHNTHLEEPGRFLQILKSFLYNQI